MCAYPPLHGLWTAQSLRLLVMLYYWSGGLSASRSLGGPEFQCQAGSRGLTGHDLCVAVRSWATLLGQQPADLHPPSSAKKQHRISSKLANLMSFVKNNDGLTDWGAHLIYSQLYYPLEISFNMSIFCLKTVIFLIASTYPEHICLPLWYWKWLLFVVLTTLEQITLATVFSETTLYQMFQSNWVIVSGETYCC